MIMTFQKTVYRQYTTGFPGDITRDGPMRAKPGRIISDNTGLNVNAISRAFGFNADLSNMGTGETKTLAAFDYEVTVGGANFYGVLGHPKHYALYGGADGALSPTDVLPQYSEGEFFDMVTGMTVELFNFDATVVDVAFGWQVAYVLNTATTGDNANNVPHGGLIALAPGAAAPAGTAIIPNARVINPVSIAASSASVLSSTYTIIQLTQ